MPQPKNDYTLVIGVDKQHLEELLITYPTWQKHKPSLMDRRMLVFYDHSQVTESEIREQVDHPYLSTVSWPYDGAKEFERKQEGKWGCPQRAKMLAGYVRVPRTFSTTPYWLKVDTDVVATGIDDWIDPDWFHSKPAIIAQAWGLTKPADQMMQLDQWAKNNIFMLPSLVAHPPLNLVPEPGANKVKHKRIISWCGFFEQTFTRWASIFAELTCDPGHIPVDSQDGYHFYVCKRMMLPIIRTNMKVRGWKHLRRRQLAQAAAESLGEV